MDIKAVETLSRDLEEELGMGVEVLDPVPVPEHAYNPPRKQYNGGRLLKRLGGIKTGEGKLLGVIDKDIYARSLNFIFGLAQISGSCALISIQRLKPRLRERALKEAVHELGHTFGLRHCKDKSCVMCFSNSLAEVDQKSSEFCERHAKEFRAQLG